ncbi:MAG: hypothetical protein B7Y02_10695, partial [Rhodobacterales bacterium 17-64-5]
MKFLTATCLVAGVSAGIVHPPTRVYERDFATITGVMADAGASIEKLTAAVNAYAGDVQPITDASEALVKTLQDGKVTVGTSDQLDLLDTAKRNIEENFAVAGLTERFDESLVMMAIELG